MLLQPNDADWQLAKSVSDEFSSKPGAQYIAKKFAMAYLSALLREIKPASVLEIGAGIGTITDLLLRHPDRPRDVTATEDHPFCLEQFALNVPQAAAEGCRLLTDQDLLDADRDSFDLVVIDAAVSDANYALFKSGTICFVEGARGATRREMNSALEARNLTCDFVNYNRGMRYFSFSLRKDLETGKTLPKFRFRNIRKGCWVGTVGPSGG